MMSFLQKLLILLILISVLPSAYCGATKPTSLASYGEKVRFRKDAPLRFPDFELTYLGERHVASAIYPRGFRFFDFEAKTPQETVKVSWSSGTGLIDPADFRIAGKNFWLEMRGSIKRGWLAANEIVVSPRPGTSP
jgi:hypothetical protein